MCSWTIHEQLLPDLNLPAGDEFGTQSAICLLRQHIDYGHWYDRTKLVLKTVDDCQYLVSLNPSAGSRQINGRLQRHFISFAVGMPSATSLITIFQTFLDGHLSSRQFNATVRPQKLALLLVNNTAIFRRVLYILLCLFVC